MAFQLGEALTEFWRVRGLFSEGRTFLERALAVNEDVKPFSASKGTECLR